MSVQEVRVDADQQTTDQQQAEFQPSSVSTTFRQNADRRDQDSMAT